MALSDIKVRSAKPEEKEYSLTDGDGMFLLVHPNGSKILAAAFSFWRQATSHGVSIPLNRTIHF